MALNCVSRASVVTQPREPAIDRQDRKHGYWRSDDNAARLQLKWVAVRVSDRLIILQPPALHHGHPGKLRDPGEVGSTTFEPSAPEPHALFPSLAISCLLWEWARPVNLIVSVACSVFSASTTPTGSSSYDSVRGSRRRIVCVEA